MNWYYVDQGKQAGPVDDAQLDQLRAAGQITDDTLIWREGMANWQAYREARGGAAPAPFATGYAPAAAATVAGTEAACVECRGMFPKENMIRYGDNWVCANCKPVFMQKLAEGAQINTGEMRYAGFWIRFAARFVDGAMLWVVNFIISLVAGVGAGGLARNNANAAAIGLQLFVFALQIAIAASYETFMIGRYGATLGKMACKIQVVTAEGQKVSYLRALGRYFSTLLSGMICLIGYIIAGFDDQKRALHDHICNTRVVFKN
jgi:uncharacterized RDD family membrane protein YckC